MILARDSITLVHVVEIESYTRYYLLQSSTLQPPAKPTSEDPADDDDWQDSEPAYTAGSTNSLYFVDKTQYSNGTYSYSEVSLSSEYEAAKTAYNLANSANTIANTANTKTVYATCGTAAGTAAKAATITPATSNYALATGDKVTVYFTYSNTHATPTLNVNSKGAKQIRAYHDVVFDKNVYSWGAKTAVPFVYNGTYWLIENPEAFAAANQAQTTADQALGEAGSAQSAADNAQNTANTALDQSVEYIEGTQTTSTGAWTGVTQDSELKVGKTIAYKLPYAGSGNASLTLTLSDGTETAAIPVYTNTSRVTTHFGANSIINLTYDGTNWRASSIPNSNNYDRRLHNNYILAATAITKNKLIAGDSSGYNNISAGLSFDLSYPILVASANIAASSQAASAYEAIPSVNFATTGAVTDIAVNKVVYLKGTVNGNVFTCAASGFLTCSIPVSEDGYYYIPLGVVANDVVTKAYFSSSNRLYAFIKGAFQPVDTAAQLLADEAHGRIDDLNIIGVNLLRNTGSFDEWKKNQTASLITYTDEGDGTKTAHFGTTTAWVTLYSAPINYSDIRNKTVTLSYWAKIDDLSVGTMGSSAFLKLAAYISRDDGNGDYTTVKYRDGIFNTYDANTDWQYITKTINITDAYFSSGTGTIDQETDVFRLYFQKHVNTAVHFKKIKLEYGESATEWSPAPGDVANASSVATQGNNRATAKYGTCATSASTAAKVVVCQDFELFTGANIHVEFTAGSLPCAMTLNVNGTGAKAVCFNGAAVNATTNMFSFVKDVVVDFMYDGTNWIPVGYPLSYYGTCSTGKYTARKVVYLDNVVKCKGTTLSVKMTYINDPSVVAPTLKLLATGATSSLAGDPITGSTRWLAGETVMFTFNGAAWEIADASLRNHFWHDSDGAHVASSSSGANVLIDSDSIDIRDEEYALASFNANGMALNAIEPAENEGEDPVVVNVASFGKDLVELGKNSPTSEIRMCGGGFSIQAVTESNMTYNRIAALAQRFLLLGQHGITLASNNDLWVSAATTIYLMMGGNDFAGNASMMGLLGDWVVERGSSITPGDSRISSGNAYYQKWASGKLEIWGWAKASSNAAFTTASSWGGYETPYFRIWGTWPVSFIERPDVNFRIVQYDSDTVNFGDYIIIQTPRSVKDGNGIELRTQGPACKLWRPGGNAVTYGAPRFSFHAVGRWK